MAKTHDSAPRSFFLSSRLTGGVLLALLPVIVVWVALEGRDFDPDLYGFGVAEKRELDAGKTGTPDGTKHVIPESLLPPFSPGGFYREAQAPVHYDRKTIYQKINGAAPAYLELGFRELLSRSYLPADPDYYGCDLYIYDMASEDGARKIYEQQRSEGAQKVQVGDGGYRFAAAWFFRQGPYYVIVLNSDEGREAEQFSEALARGISKRIVAAPSPQ